VAAQRPFWGAIRMGIGANAVLVLKLRVTGCGETLAAGSGWKYKKERC